MRILFLNPVGTIGGAEISLLEILSCLREEHPDWPLGLALGQDGALAGRARKLGVKVFVKPFPRQVSGLGDSGGPRGLRGSFRLLSDLLRAIGPLRSYDCELRSCIQAFSPDVIHSNGFKMHIAASRAATNDTPVIWHLRDYISSRPIMRKLLKFYSRRCRVAITNSDSVAVDARRVFGTSLRMIRVHNVVDTRAFSPTGPRLNLDEPPDLPPAPDGTVRVGMLGTFARWKGHEVFLRALAILPQDLAVRGYIIGGPQYQTRHSQYSFEELRAMADRLGISSRIRFTGFIEDRAAAIRALDILVHASTEPEPFGLVIAEGMACERAVISADQGGSTEIATDGIDTLRHRAGDHEDLAAKIRVLVVDANKRTVLAAEARRTILARFSHTRLERDLLGIYTQITRDAVRDLSRRSRGDYAA